MTDVLVVDDDERAARSFVDMIVAQTGLEAIWTSKPLEALEIVKQAEIEVAVLDQRMPEMSGMQLANEIWRLSPETRIVLFSGRMEQADYEEALQSGRIQFLSKQQVDQLPDLTYRLHVDHRASIAAQAYETPVAVEVYRSGFSFRGPKVTVTLLGVEDVTGASDVWLEDRFRVVVNLQAGQNQKFSRMQAREAQVLFEEERSQKETRSTQVSAKATFSLPLKPEIATQATIGLEQSIRSRVQSTLTHRIEEKVEVTYDLPPDLTTPDGHSIRAREIQESPIYERKRSRVRVSCECCGMDNTKSIAILVFTGRWKSRQVDFLSDGSTRTVLTN